MNWARVRKVARRACKGADGEGSGGDSSPPGRTSAPGPLAARVGASSWPGPQLIPRRGPAAERMSAQVRTRLRFRHLRAAAGGAGSELEKVGPVRPLAPGAPGSLQRRRRLRARGARHYNRGTGAAPSPNVPPPSTSYPTEVSPAPPQRLPPGEGHPRRGLDGTGRVLPGPRNEAPRRCPSELRTCAAVPPARQPRRSPASSGVGGSRQPEFDRGAGVSARGRCQHLDGGG